MKTLVRPSIDVEILETVVAPDEPTLTTSVARAFLKLSFSEEQQERIEGLLDRNSEGTITDAERDQLEAYVRVGNFLSLLQAKARATLSHKSGK